MVDVNHCNQCGGLTVGLFAGVDSLDPNSSESLYQRADAAKKREFENNLVDAYQVNFQCLHLASCANSYVVDMIIRGDKIYKNGILDVHGSYSKAALSKGGLVYGDKRIELIDKYMTMYTTPNYRVTVNVNKVKVDPKTPMFAQQK